MCYSIVTEATILNYKCFGIFRCGIPMLPKQHGLPTQCFISAEVVDWCYYHVKGVKGVKSAMEMLQVCTLKGLNNLC
jgi:hypothetical protein